MLPCTRAFFMMFTSVLFQGSDATTWHMALTWGGTANGDLEQICRGYWGRPRGIDWIPLDEGTKVAEEHDCVVLCEKSSECNVVTFDTYAKLCFRKSVAKSYQLTARDCDENTAGRTYFRNLPIDCALSTTNAILGNSCKCGDTINCRVQHFCYKKESNVVQTCEELPGYCPPTSSGCVTLCSGALTMDISAQETHRIGDWDNNIQALWVKEGCFLQMHEDEDNGGTMEEVGGGTHTHGRILTMQSFTCTCNGERRLNEDKI
eukprot:GEMP01028364.1.p1 GENE.GEMP01028364.1~~GEMP01028364.1.p1  ORF type:complete len:262 (+),score=32.36 GEMP01028364.1:109-894(+)